MTHLTKLFVKFVWVRVILQHFCFQKLTLKKFAIRSEELMPSLQFRKI